MNKKIFLILNFLPVLIIAQSLSPSVIGSSSGGYYANSAGSLSFTVGQPAGATLQSGGYILSQGFQQPELNVQLLSITGPFCNGDSITVPFLSQGIFASSNIFEAQLSDASGSFASPTTLGTLNAASGGSISGQIPFSIPAGSNYKVKVKASFPAISSSQSTQTINFCWVRLDLSLFLQGFYNGGSSMTPVLFNNGISADPTEADSIVVALHASTGPYAEVISLTTILHTDGTASCLFPASVYGNVYYVVIRHRNHIQTWSKFPLLINGAEGYFSFAN
jgi:hypothetical protein